MSFFSAVMIAAVQFWQNCPLDGASCSKALYSTFNLQSSKKPFNKMAGDSGRSLAYEEHAFCQSNFKAVRKICSCCQKLFHLFHSCFLVISSVLKKLNWMYLSISM